MTSGLLDSRLLLWGLPILLGIGVSFWLFLKVRSNNTDLQIQRKSKILSQAEKSFFECLFSALSDDFYIFAKVCVLDTVEATPAAGRSDIRKIMKQLKGECFDYVMCKKHDLSIFGVVELENFEKRSSQKGRKNREALISQVCKTAHLRLFYFDVRQDYQGVDIKRLVTGRTGKNRGLDSSQATQLTLDNTSYAAYAKKRSCPKCNGEVVTKVAVKGKNIGEKYLMCRKYPYCDYRVSLSDSKVVEMERHQKAQDKKPGFSDWSAG